MNRTMKISLGLMAIRGFQGIFSQETVTWINPVDSMEFVSVPAGELTASVKNKNDLDSLVTITFAKSFLIAKTEVTVGQFKKFVDATGHITRAEQEQNRFTWRSPGFAQEQDHPAVFVSYEDAQAYATWAGLDLPSEAEWLYACRAGATTSFYWGDSLNDDYLWHRGNTKGTGTRPVATRKPNKWGLYDMVGNVREYVTVCDVRYAERGSSWTRCPSYKTRQGFIADDLIAGSVTARLTECLEPQHQPYPYDDDRGFRLVKRQ
ncbi:hypothetical protein EH223_08690 [candidate division KSB1 bacterium]|nr:SUMF1/EgtB/PvdO family nonheme iron enzyme [candidate division KSB1 bacterium]RQW03901.1 MAG: hypothetical protein EH223_08690 [candidate division KSB1 bacterium]